MPTDQVIVAGGGIGGLGAALMIARRGVQVTVLEQAPEFGEVGAGLQLAPNITRMLDEMGVLEKILPHSVKPERLVFRNAQSGEELTHLDLADAERRYGGPYIVLHRSDLLNALLTAAEAEQNITLLTGHRVTELVDRGDLVSARCANGAELSSQLLLGADGLRSLVRRHLLGDETVASGYVAYRGAVPIEEFGRPMDMDHVTVWMGPGLHLVQYPVRAGKLYNQVAVFRSQMFQEGKRDWGNPAELDAAYESMAQEVRDAVPHLQRINRWPMEDREPVTSWVQGRIALLGDAAHPMLQYLAQGAGQALLDGASLARNLGDLGGGAWASADLGAALERYEEERVAAAGTVQSTARIWGDIWHVEPGVPMMLRDHAFRSREIRDYSLVDWLYGPVVDTSAQAESEPAGSVTARRER